MEFTLDTRRFEADLRRLEQRQMPQAIAEALTNAAKDVLEHVHGNMEVVFDRPVKFTKNAFMVWRAKPSNLVASVIERPSVGKNHYLKVQERGGPRPQTGFEKLLGSRLAYAGILRTVIPGDNAKLDEFGNWPYYGERNKALSVLQAQRDPLANETARSKKRAKGRASYFVPKHGLPPGIYRRKPRAARGAIEILAIFSDKVPVYQPRLGFFDGAQARFDEVIGPRLTQAIDKALATAR
ncbi:hypothetical protein C8N33_106272 [Pararhodobacter aggregans]|nr:hypothetical protein C8N33_106272 [Pararhodobacter aggregans]